MRNNIKLVALDMDGTSFYKGSGIVEANIEPIKRCEKAGVKVVFLTGRPIICKHNLDIKKHNMIDENTIIIGFNGALVRRLKTGENLSAELIKKDVIEKVFKFSKQYKPDEMRLWAYGVDEKNVFVTRDVKGDPILEIETNFFDGKVHIYDEKTEFTDCYKIICAITNQQCLDKLEEFGLSYFGGLNRATEVVSNKINKGIALEKLGKMLSITKDQMLTIGDGENDVPMLEHADYSFAPNNATEQAKKAAKVVSDLNYEDGAVAQILKDFVLEGDK